MTSSRSRAHLSADDVDRALRLRDLTDPSQGTHAMQVLLDGVLRALEREWGCAVVTVRNPPIVAVADNYDRLGFDPADVTRDARYTRYVSPTTMLRSHTSADIPHALRRYATSPGPVDELLVVPGLVYRRDVVDRTHVGEPHQVDLWRLHDTRTATDADLEEMVALVVEAVLPGARQRLVPSSHAYTEGGRQVDVRHDDRWLELAECGRIHPRVLHGAGLDPARWSGLALGMGLDRALMLRKAIPDIRFLRSSDSRVADQMLDLEPWRPVSALPPVTRDLSVVLGADTDEEIVGDTVRSALQERVEDLESVELLARTAYDDLPRRARERLRLAPDQVNGLVRLTLRPTQRTLTDDEANEIRDIVYLALHEGPVLELASAAGRSGAQDPAARRSPGTEWELTGTATTNGAHSP